MVKLSEVEELVRSIQAGNSEKFSDLMKVFEPLMKKMYQTYRIPYVDFEDFMQEASIALFQTLDQYEPSKSNNFPAFYKISLKHHIFSTLRKEYAKSKVPYQIQVSSDLPQYFEQMNQSSGTNDQSYSAEEVSLLKEASEEYVTRLSELEKEILTQHIKGKKISQIAAEHAYSHIKVLHAFNRCRRKLKVHLEMTEEKSVYRTKARKKKSSGDTKKEIN